MFFAKRMWLLVAIATPIAAFFIIEAVAIVQIPLLAAPEYGPNAFLATVLFGTALLIAIGLYVGWLKKYYDYFKLRGLITARLQRGDSLEFRTADGTSYSITGEPTLYTVKKTPHGVDTTHVYSISDTFFWAGAQTTTSRVYLGGVGFDEYEYVKIAPLQVSAGAAFKSLIKALNTPVQT